MKFTTQVVSGHGRGKFLGYPTLNLIVPPKFSEESGIYAGFVWIEEKKFSGAFHYGPVPTFDQEDWSLEVFVLDTQLSVTPDQLEFELVYRLRDIQTFASETTLVDQISKDVDQTKAMLDRI